jgi:SSS family transporter
LYFGVVFGIGWLSLKRTKSEEDYWIAGGNLGWLLGGTTIAATHTSAGSFMGTIGVMYSAGWSFGWLILSIPLAYWFMAAVLAPRFIRVKELTLPGFVESRYYSKRTRALAAAIILLATVVYIQAQIVAGGLIASTVFGIPTTIGMVGFTLILLVYTAIGGMLAVVYTDFLQIVIMVIGVLFALPLAVRHVGGWGDLFQYVQAVNPATFTFEAFPPVLLFTMGLAFLLGSVSSPAQLIRLYAMKDMRAVRRGILLAILLITGVNLMIFLLSLVSVVLFPALPTGDLAMPMIARTVLPAFLGGIMLAAITSEMMSTVDSLLIVAGSALSQDIYQTLIDPEMSEGKRVVVDRIGVMLVGTVPVLLILSGHSVHRAALHGAHGLELFRARRRRRVLEACHARGCGGGHDRRSRRRAALGAVRIRDRRSGTARARRLGGADAGREPGVATTAPRGRRALLSGSLRSRHRWPARWWIA